MKLSLIISGGVIAGVAYALIGWGLVLIYRQSGVLNFAHGAVVTAAGYGTFEAIQHGLPYWAAALVGIAVGAALSGLIEFLVVRPLTRSGALTIAIATFGIAMLLIGLMSVLFGNDAVALPSPVPLHGSLHLAGFSMSYSQLVMLGLTCVIGLLISFGLNRTRVGLAVRAASEGPMTASMMGINTSRIQLLVWTVAGVLAGIDALFLVPSQYLDPRFPTQFLIAAFPAIVLGGIESLGGVFVGSLLYGLLTSAISYYFSAKLTNTVGFILLAALLAVLPFGLFGRRLQKVNEVTVRGHRRRGRLASVRHPLGRLAGGLGWSIPARVRLAVLCAAGVAIVVLLPYTTSSTILFAATSSVAFFLATLGQGILTGYSGQLGIGQGGYILVGAYAYAILRAHAGFGALPGLIASLVVTALVGLILGAASVRLSGIYYALLTLVFALAMPQLITLPEGITGGASGISPPGGTFVGISLLSVTGQFYAVVLVAVVVGALARWAMVSRLGKTWLAVRDSEAGAAALGISVYRARVSAATLSAALAGLSGGLSAMVIGYIAPDSFDIFLSVLVLVAMVVGGAGTVVGAVVGAAFVQMIPVLTSSGPQIPDVLFGGSLLVVLYLAPQGLTSLFSRVLHRPLAWHPPASLAEPPGDIAPLPASTQMGPAT